MNNAIRVVRITAEPVIETFGEHRYRIADCVVEPYGEPARAIYLPQFAGDEGWYPVGSRALCVVIGDESSTVYPILAFESQSDDHGKDDRLLTVRGDGRVLVGPDASVNGATPEGFALHTKLAAEVRALDAKISTLVTWGLALQSPSGPVTSTSVPALSEAVDAHNPEGGIVGGDAADRVVGRPA